MIRKVVEVQMPRKTASKLTISEGIATSIEQGSEVAAKEGINVATIPKVATAARFVKENILYVLIVSAKDAFDTNNEMLEGGDYKVDQKSGTIERSSEEEIKVFPRFERLHISRRAADIIKKTKEDGQERLLAFDGRGVSFRDSLCVDSFIWSAFGARVVGEKQAQAVKAQTDALAQKAKRK